MSVEDWARRESKWYATAGDYDERGRAFSDGIVHAFSALLSDEAVEAAADKTSDATEPGDWSMVARSALQAAIDAVTEGDTE